MRPGVAPVILPGLVRRVSCQDIGIPLAAGPHHEGGAQHLGVESAVLARWWSLLWSTTCLTFRLLWMARLWPSRSAVRSAQSAGGILDSEDHPSS